MILSGDTSGAVTVTVPTVAGTNTVTIPAVTGTVVIGSSAVSAVGQIPFSTDGTSFTPTAKITTATAQVTTSGTSIDFTSIPSWVKRITVLLNGVSTNGTSVIQVQLGDSGGVETSGYLTMAGLITTTNNTTRGAVFTAGFPTSHGGATGDAWRGAITFSLYGSNLWVGSGTVYNSTDSITMISGTKTLSDTLTQVRLTTVNGTDTFDAGAINILYE
jgi:hypothetical protein